MTDKAASLVIPAELSASYFRFLVNSFFKILPIRENEEPTLLTYMQSLQNELLGCKGLMTELQHDSGLVTLIAILQFLIDNPDCSIREVKREVFKAISICNRLERRYEKVVTV